MRWASSFPKILTSCLFTLHFGQERVTVITTLHLSDVIVLIPYPLFFGTGAFSQARQNRAFTVNLGQNRSIINLVLQTMKRLLDHFFFFSDTTYFSFVNPLCPRQKKKRRLHKIALLQTPTKIPPPQSPPSTPFHNPRNSEPTRTFEADRVPYSLQPPHMYVLSDSCNSSVGSSKFVLGPEREQGRFDQVHEGAASKRQRSSNEAKHMWPVLTTLNTGSNRNNLSIFSSRKVPIDLTMKLHLIGLSHS